MTFIPYSKTIKYHFKLYNDLWNIIKKQYSYKNVLTKVSTLSVQDKLLNEDGINHWQYFCGSCVHFIYYDYNNQPSA